MRRADPHHPQHPAARDRCYRHPRRRTGVQHLHPRLAAASGGGRAARRGRCTGGGHAAGRSDPLPDHFELRKARPARRSTARHAARISKRAFRHFMPRPSAKSSVATACSTPGQGSDPRAQPIALLAHQDVVPVAPGTEKDWQQPPFDGVMPTASSGAAAPGTTRATSIPCWRPPKRWPRPASAPSARSISRSAMTRRSPAPPAPSRSRRCWPRAASASTS